MKKPMKRRNNRLLEAVLHYLKSDTYLFAPLISPPPTGFTETNTPSSSSPLSERSEMKEASRGDSSGMLTNVGEYLKSDSFMAPWLLLSQLVLLQVVLFLLLVLVLFE
ncbi:uncharacterized protein LOC120010210 [Tripterygium wilfordii]|uniref:uncharacterized protein LOC120010210 n=1 Tax=Tripterygium wilfordii TaxID=458696 RepID=UPI0018F7F2C9|nr:uncharacterized protein LOC120010210 [Tripterygium wilfordii]